MFTWMNSLLKTIIFIGLILILSHKLQWKGKSISEHTKIFLHKVEYSPWAKKKSRQVNQWFHNNQLEWKSDQPQETISPQEEEKLKNILKRSRRTSR